MTRPRSLNYINSRFLALFIFTVLNLQGCATPQVQSAEQSTALPTPPTLSTLYHSIILDSRTQDVLSIETLAQQLRSADVVFIGEFHGNHASHLLQAELQAALYTQRPNQILSMEQFNRDQQPFINRYLDEQIGETYLVNETPTWNNYVASYRPLVEFAKAQMLPVIAANAPADTVRCIGRHGTDYLNQLTGKEAAEIAEHPFEDVAGYKAFFMNFLKGAKRFDKTRAENSYLAQLTRDNTMAESILKAHQTHPNAQIIHTNGAFHSNNGLGTVGALKRLDSSLSIKVISPIQVEGDNPLNFADKEYAKGDFIYLLQAQPTQYRDASYRQKVFKRMFDNADAKVCRGEGSDEER